MLGDSNMRQIDYAIKHKCVFLTHNRIHYEKLYTELIAKGIRHKGIVIASRRNVYELAKRVSRVLSGYTKESAGNQLFYV